MNAAQRRYHCAACTSGQATSTALLRDDGRSPAANNRGSTRGEFALRQAERVLCAGRPFCPLWREDAIGNYCGKFLARFFGGKFGDGFKDSARNSRREIRGKKRRSSIASRTCVDT